MSHKNQDGGGKWSGLPWMGDKLAILPYSLKRGGEWGARQLWWEGWAESYTRWVAWQMCQWTLTQTQSLSWVEVHLLGMFVPSSVVNWILESKHKRNSKTYRLGNAFASGNEYRANTYCIWVGCNWPPSGPSKTCMHLNVRCFFKHAPVALSLSIVYKPVLRRSGHKYQPNSLFTF